jgi:malate synthase
MSAQIPIKGDEKANATAMNKVRADKLREVTNGHDGTWIAHPLINKIAREIFDQHMMGPNQVRIRLFVYTHSLNTALCSITYGGRMFVLPLPTC